MLCLIPGFCCRKTYDILVCPVMSHDLSDVLLIDRVQADIISGFEMRHVFINTQPPPPLVVLFILLLRHKLTPLFDMIITKVATKLIAVNNRVILRPSRSRHCYPPCRQRLDLCG